MQHLSTSRKRVLAESALCIAVAAAAGAGVITAFLSGAPVAALILGSLLFFFALYLSGNPRLFLFWGLLMAAPLEFGKNFMPNPHMGGAASYSITLADVLLVPLLILIIRDNLRGTRSHLRIPRIAIYWAGMMLLGLYSVAVGPYRHVPFQEVVHMLKLLLLFLVVVNEVVRRTQFVHAVGALAAGVLLQSLIAMTQYSFRTTLGLEFLGEASHEAIQYASDAAYRGGSAVFRVGGLMGHPNLLAAYLALLVPVCLAVMMSRIRPLYKALAAAAAFSGMFVLLLTLSRTGWLSFAAAFLALVLLSFVPPVLRRRYLLIRVTVIGFVAVMAIAFAGAIERRFTQSDPGAWNFRSEWNKASFRMIREKPLLGFGLNTYAFNMPPYTRYAGPKEIINQFGMDWPVVHNTYLLVWAEQGTFGLLLLLAFKIHLLWLAFQNAKRLNDITLLTINIGMMAGLIGICVDGLGSFFFRNPASGRVVWIAAALIVAIHYWRTQNTPHAQKARSADTPALPSPQGVTSP